LVIVLWKQTSNISQKVGFIGIVAFVSICIAGPIFNVCHYQSGSVSRSGERSLGVET